MTLLTGSDMSVINSGPKRKNYSDHSSYSYSGIGLKRCALNLQGRLFDFCWDVPEGVDGRVEAV